MSQSVVLCEGWDDRAFWTGWLLRLGCRAAEAPERRDEWGRPVAGGRYLFFTPSGDRIVLEPCHGRDLVARAARTYFQEKPTRPLRRLALNVDSDRSAAASGAEVGQVPDDLRNLILREQLPEERDTPVVRGIEILPVVWECADPPASGLPDSQTLERLVSAAIAEVYPGRGASVARWLTDPPAGEPGSKNHALSYLAKWYASHGQEDFYAHVWRDQQVAAALEQRLRATGAWSAAERLVAL